MNPATHYIIEDSDGREVAEAFGIDNARCAARTLLTESYDGPLNLKADKHWFAIERAELNEYGGVCFWGTTLATP